MTPPGVEHPSEASIVADIVRVSGSETPTGVEHFCWLIWDCWSIPVSGSVTPTGVEHNMQTLEQAAASACPGQ